MGLTPPEKESQLLAWVSPWGCWPERPGALAEGQLQGWTWVVRECAHGHTCTLHSDTQSLVDTPALTPTLPFPGHSHPLERGPLYLVTCPPAGLGRVFDTSCCRCDGARCGRVQSCLFMVVLGYGDLAPNAAAMRP